MRIKKEWVVRTGIGIGSFGLGALVSYVFTKRRYVGYVKTKEEELEELESIQLQLDFERVERSREFNHMIQEAAHVVREFKDEGRNFLTQFSDNGDDKIDIIVTEEEIVIETHPSNFVEEAGVNVFVEEDDGWDYDEEVKHRDPKRPYIIHVDEYFNNEMDYSQTSITFYAGDRVLCDELDVPIYNAEKIVGILEFGKGSRDPSLCYVRNEHLEAEYEVVLDEGHYQVEILGAEAETALSIQDLKHSVRKFRTE